MDTAVALVQAYLHVNGYFTVAEYPVLEAYRGDHARTVTDLDILAVRFAGAGHEVIRRRKPNVDDSRIETDPALHCPSDRPDMIVGEVKEGAARFNAAMRDPAVLEVALARFGCCNGQHARHVVQQLLSGGHAIAPGGHSVRMIAFGDVADGDPPMTWTTISMRHVVRFLQQHLRAHWDVLRHAQIRDPALGVLTLLEKWGAGGDAGASIGQQDRRRNRGGMRMRRGA